MVVSSLPSEEANEPPEPPSSGTALQFAILQSRTASGSSKLPSAAQTGQVEGRVGNTSSSETAQGSRSRSNENEDVNSTVFLTSEEDTSVTALRNQRTATPKISPPPPPPTGGSESVQDHHDRQVGSTSRDQRSVTEIPPHTRQPGEIAAEEKVSLQDGLDSVEVAARLEKYGQNKLESGEGVSTWKVLLRQVSNALTLILVAAMALAFGTLDFVEGAVIAAVILLNVVIGFFQDYRAEKSMQSLQSLSAPVATVIRNRGEVVRIKAEDIVKGDIVSLKMGDVVPADMRLFDGMNFETDEALLTGESLPAAKTPYVTIEQVDISVGDRTNMAYASSTVTKGRAFGIVTSTGMSTEVGGIAELLRNTNPNAKKGNSFLRGWKKVVDAVKNILGLVGTPLQIKLSKFALLLFVLAIVLAIIVFSVHKWKISDETLIYGICVAVAVVPESLSCVLTITLAVGRKAMAKHHVVVRRVQALEAVGGVTHICSDKTGTLTQGKMVVRSVYTPSCSLTVEDTTDPLDPQSGVLRLYGTEILPSETLEKFVQLEPYLDAMSLCNLASISHESALQGEKPRLTNRSQSAWKAVGEPTEIALQVFASRFGRDKKTLINSSKWTSVHEHPFDSSIKRMTVIYENTYRKTVEAFTKGAEDVLVPLLEMPQDERNKIHAVAEQMAGEGLRVLCLAHKILNSIDHKNRELVETGMTFLGLVGLYDPPRPETIGAIKTCRAAGIEVKMLTGDHIKTATAIAYDIGILSPMMSLKEQSTMVMTAGRFDTMADDELDGLPDLPKVVARCTPKTKVRMLEAIHRRKGFCAMTGDGVNDAPALKRADIGIAMGLNGSDVAKDASDLVLTNDDFASIVKAIEEGRRLFDNIQKFLMHLLISNIAQVVLLMVGLAFRDANGISIFPLSPLEILWANMITSSFLALGLGLEEAQPDIMRRCPRDVKQGVFTWELITDKMIYGIWMGILCLISFISVVYGYGKGNLGLDCNDNFNESCKIVYQARATVFSVLSFLLLLTAWEVKHFSRSLFNLDPTRHKGPFAVFHALWYNRFLFWAVVAGFVTTFPVLYIPVVNRRVFHHLGISWQWGLVFGCCLLYVGLIESWKAIKRRYGIFGRKYAAIEDEEKRADRISDEGSFTDNGNSLNMTRSNTLIETQEYGGKES